MRNKFINLDDIREILDGMFISEANSKIIVHNNMYYLISSFISVDKMPNSPIELMLFSNYAFHIKDNVIHMDKCRHDPVLVKEAFDECGWESDFGRYFHK